MAWTLHNWLQKDLHPAAVSAYEKGVAMPSAGTRAVEQESRRSQWNGMPAVFDDSSSWL